MSQKTKSVTYSILVEPYDCVLNDPSKAPNFVLGIKRIMAEIKRHVDDVRSVSIQADSENVCGYCERRWTEKSKDYNGGCCDMDEDAHEAIIRAAAVAVVPTASESSGKGPASVMPLSRGL